MRNVRFGLSAFVSGCLALVTVVAFALTAFAQSSGSDGGWFDPGSKDNKNAAPRPAPPHNISGTWLALNGVQAVGVQAMPNDGRPEHQLPFTPYGLKVYKSHKALEGFDAVPPGDYNDPREVCEPLGFPRANHYNLRLTQISQDAYKVAIFYHYDNRWRLIWTDGRALPKVVEGGVKTGDRYQDQRFYGFSVGKWTDDATLVVQTVGTMPEDRVWLDSTGRPISDQVKVTETYHRVNYDTLELSETIDDPKIYTRPWVSMDKLQMQLQDPHTDIQEFGCSPVEQQRYDNLTAPDSNFKGSSK